MSEAVPSIAAPGWPWGNQVADKKYHVDKNYRAVEEIEMRNDDDDEGWSLSFRPVSFLFLVQSLVSLQFQFYSFV